MTRFEKTMLSLLIVYIIMVGILILNLRAFKEATTRFERAARGACDRPLKMEIVVEGAE